MSLEREKRLYPLVLLVLKVNVCPPLWFTLILWVCGLSYCDSLWLTLGPLSYLVLALLLYVPLWWLLPCGFYFLVHYPKYIYCMVLLKDHWTIYCYGFIIKPFDLLCLTFLTTFYYYFIYLFLWLLIGPLYFTFFI